MKKTRIAVIGVGTVGSMALWHLARMGVEAVGFEQFYPGHAAGAAAGDTRLCRVASEDPAYVPMSRRGRALWRELERESGLHLYDACGSISIGHRDAPHVVKVAENAKRFGLDHHFVGPQQLRKNYPGVPVNDDEIGFFDNEAGQVMGQNSIVAAALSAERRGATILSETKVTDIRSVDGGVRFRAGQEEWQADRLILSPGPWLNGMLPDALPPVAVLRVPVYWYPLRNPERYRPSRFPLLERQSGNSFFYAWPTKDGATLKVAMGPGRELHRIAHPIEHNQELLADMRERMDAEVRAHLPDVVPVQVRHAFGIDGFTQDRNFLLGPLKQHPNVLALTGMSGHGFKMAPVTGLMAANWATDAQQSEEMREI